jgi:NH3-dependent NAD+ synthetase
LQDVDFLAAAAVGFVQTADFDEAVGVSGAVDSNHVVLLCRDGAVGA